MVSKGRHPKAPIAKALKAVGRDGLAVHEIHKGHRWGVLTCTHCGSSLAVWSTPRVPEDVAAAIHKFDLKHRHEETR